MQTYLHTKERFEIVKRMWDDGVPMDKIAEAVNVSYQAMNAQIYRMQRAGQILRRKKSGQAVPRPASVPKPRSAPDPVADLAMRGAQNGRHVVPAFTLSFIAIPIYVAPTIGLSDKCGCTWPMWEHGVRPGFDARYCDEPRIVGRSYCPAHHQQSRAQPSKAA